MVATRNWIKPGMLAAALIAAAVSASAQPFGRSSVRAEARGMLKSVDVAARTITIAVFEGRQPAADKTFALAKDVEVALDIGGARRGFFKEGKLSELVAGTPVGLTLTADLKTVEAIVAEALTVRGVLKSVDVDKKSITINLRRGREEGDEEKTYAVASGAEVAVDDGLGRRVSVKEAKLADLASGSIVTVRLSADQKQAESILAEGPNIGGQLKEIDAAKNTVTLFVPPAARGEQPEEKTFELSKNTLVLLDDGRGRRLSVKEGKLGDVPTGASVMIRMSPDQKSVTMLRAEGPNMPCMIKSVDAAKGTITVATRVPRGDNPEEKTFTLAKDVRVLIEGTESKLADIKPGNDGPFAMLRLSLDQKTVQGIVVGRGRQ